MTPRVAVVTGVGGGIGSATAARLLAEGWAVVGTDIRDVGAQLQGLTHFSRCDVSSEGDVRRLVVEVDERCGRLDALVNNAGIQIAKPIVAMSVTEWDTVMASNVRAAYLTVAHMHPLLVRGRGAVVNVSSVHAIATSTNISCYAASKAALLGLTRALAIELAPDGIRVNAVLPGAVDTAMLRDGLSRGHLAGETLEARLEALAGKTALGRVGRPDEIARAILFLADSEQSSFMTGQALVVDGGATARLSTE